MSTMCDYYVSPHHITDITSHHITHYKPKEENTQKKFLGRVLGPDGSPHHITDITSHHITHYKPKEENTEKKLLGRVLGPDRRNLTTSHITHDRISPDTRYHISPHHTSYLHANDKPKEENTKKKFLGRVLGPDGSPHHMTHHTFTSHHIRQHKPKVRKSTSFIVKTW